MSAEDLGEKSRASETQDVIPMLEVVDPPIQTPSLEIRVAERSDRYAAAVYLSDWSSDSSTEASAGNSPAIPVPDWPTPVRYDKGDLLSLAWPNEYMPTSVVFQFFGAVSSTDGTPENAPLEVVDCTNVFIECPGWQSTAEGEQWVLRIPDGAEHATVWAMWPVTEDIDSSGERTATWLVSLQLTSP